MILLLVLGLAVHTTVGLDITCEEGVDIETQEVEYAEDMVGNWTYIYHWDNINKYNSEFVEDASERLLRCPEIEILHIDPEMVEEKKEECSDEVMPFDWDDAKLMLNADLMNIRDSIIFMGEEENWMMMDCKNMLRVEMRQVSDDVMVMINPEVAFIAEMMSKKPIRLSELKCLVYNVDVGKGMNGVGLCH